MLVVRVVVMRVLVVQRQNFLSLAARSSGPRGSGTNAKYSQGMPRVVVVRTQNNLSPPARVNGSRCSGARGSGTNSKFS